MPVIKSAKKKLKQEKVRTLRNKKLKETYKKALKKAEKDPSSKNILEAISATDKTAKGNIIHKNKASRIKSKLAKLIKTKQKSAKKNK